jgi:hypothetical protein
MDAAVTKWIQSLEDRIELLEKQISVDKFKSEQEKTRRENKKEAAKAERLTVRAKKADDGTLLLAENVRDPIKFNGLVKKKVIEKVVHVSDPHRGEWIVNRGAANREGYIIIDA